MSGLNKIFIFFCGVAFFCAHSFLASTLFAQETSVENNTSSTEDTQPLETNDELPDKKVLTGEEIDWKKFRNFGFFRLDDVKEEVEKRLKIEADFREIVILQIEETNQGLIDNLKVLLGEKYVESEDYSLLRSLLLEALKPAVQEENTVTSSEIEREASLTGLLLNYAARVEYFENVKNGKTQSMVELYGDVEISIGANIISANYVLLNLSTSEVFAEDEVSLRSGDNFFTSDRLVFDLKDRQGYAANASGILENRFFRSKFVTINKSNDYTIKNGWITFSITPDPFYTVSGSTIDSFGTEKVISWNTTFQVGDHNFFWFPYYIAYPLTTGVKMRFGENRREGFYALNSVNLTAAGIGEIAIDFNVYEKLGMYLQFANSNNFSWITYKVFLGLAAYTANMNVRNEANRLLYTHQTDSYINSPSFFRHVFRYEQKIYLNKAEVLFGKKPGSSAKANFNQTLQANITNASDPFIRDNFSGNYSHMDWQKILERHSRDESLYSESISDYNFYKLFYNASLPGMALAASFSWKYGVYKDPEKDDEDPIDERYKAYLKTLENPSIAFRYSGFFDRQQTTRERGFYLNLGYSVYLNYANTKNYKDGSINEDADGIDFTVKPYELLNEVSSFSTGFEIFRTFTLGRDAGSSVVVPIDWFRWTLSPKFVFGFQRDRVPIQNTASNNLRDDRDGLNMLFKLSNVLGFNTTKIAWSDVSLSQTISLQDTRSEYFLLQQEKISNPDFEQKKVSVLYNFSSGLKVQIPSGAMSSMWSKSYDYTSMLPTANFVLNYSQAKSTSEEDALDESKKYSFDRFNSRSFSSSFSFQQKGYGLFYAPNLDYSLKSSLGFSYDLMPVQNEEGDYESTDFFSEVDAFWREDRISKFDGSTSFSLSYHYTTLENSLSYSFFDTDEEKIKKELKNYSLNFSLKYERDEKKKTNPWFSFDSFAFGYKWAYNFQEDSYQADSMSVSLGMSFLLLRYTKIAISFSATNPDAARYFKKKSQFLGFDEEVNFFTDVANSMGFAGKTKQENALFKFSNFSLSVSHDLGDWFARLSYVLTPVAFSEKSFRGYYLDHKVEFQVNLLPSRDPRGSGSEPLFEKVEKSFSPTL